MAPALVAGALLAAAGGSLGFGGLRAAPDERQITIYNIHTKETTTATFKRGGEFLPDGLAKINHAMRDWRIDEEIEIDPELVDLLWQLHTELRSNEPIQLISGHRSKKTNDMLRRNRGGQAKRSQHILGKAADVRFPDVPIERLRNTALIKQRGGVGYYPRSGIPFVHVDTGRVRHWPHIPEATLARIMSGKATAGAREVRVARAEPAHAPAPLPRTKPELEDEAAPMQLAEVLMPRGESVEQPTPRRLVAPDPQKVADASDGPSLRPTLPSLLKWGQSVLEPSPPRSHRPAPANTARHIVVASPAVEPIVGPDGGRSAPQVATGYASGTAGARQDRIAALLTRGADDLRGLIAGVGLIQDGDDAAVQRGDGKPLELRPAVLTGADQARPERSPPLVTASLIPPSAPQLTAHRRDIAGAGQALFAPPPAPVMGPAPQLFAALLSAPVQSHAMTFEPAMGGPLVEATFTVADRHTDAAADQGGGLGFVGRALSWIFGS